MVPFYGQGMNAGFEDVRILFDFLERRDPATNNLHSFGSIIKAYSERRVPDQYAILDLALQNHTELSSSVISKHYVARKNFEYFLYKYFPFLKIVPAYILVSFSPDVSYSRALAKGVFYKRLFNFLLFMATIGCLALGRWIVQFILQRRRRVGA